MDPLAPFIDSLRISSGHGYENLAVFPVVGSIGWERSFLSIDEALSLNLLEIMEVSEQGSVSDIACCNRSLVPVLLVDGEEVVGARTDRIVNTTILVAASTTAMLPVSCVERGRWYFQSVRCFTGGNLYSSRGRASKMRDVGDRVRQSHNHRSDQSRVFKEVDDLSARLHVCSPTAAMTDVFVRHRSRLDDYVSAFLDLDGCLGFVACIGCRLAGLDVFATPRMFRTYLDKMIRSYAIDALGTEEEDRPMASLAAMADRFLGGLRAARREIYPSVSLGSDLRLEGDGIIGAALVHEDRVVHLSAFPARETLVA